MLPPELSTGSSASQGPWSGVLMDVPTVIPSRASGLTETGGQGSTAIGGGATSKAGVGLKESLSDSEKVALLLHTLQAERDQFVLKHQCLVEQHEAEVHSFKSKGKSPAVQKNGGSVGSACPVAAVDPGNSSPASIPLSSPVPPLASPTLPLQVGQSTSGSSGTLAMPTSSVSTSETLAVTMQPAPAAHDPTVEKVIAAVVVASDPGIRGLLGGVVIFGHPTSPNAWYISSCNWGVKFM
jgi:hypothetical protein